MLPEPGQADFDRRVWTHFVAWLVLFGGVAVAGLAWRAHFLGAGWADTFGFALGILVLIGLLSLLLLFVTPLHVTLCLILIRLLLTLPWLLALCTAHLESWWKRMDSPWR